jgi:hypothetical protein
MPCVRMPRPTHSQLSEEPLPSSMPRAGNDLRDRGLPSNAPLRAGCAGHPRKPSAQRGQAQKRPTRARWAICRDVERGVNHVTYDMDTFHRSGLESLRDWLVSLGVTHVGMERRAPASTGSPFMPCSREASSSSSATLGTSATCPGARLTEGRRVDCRSGPAWPDRKELRAAASAAGPPPPRRCPGGGVRLRRSWQSSCGQRRRHFGRTRSSSRPRYL